MNLIKKGLQKWLYLFSTLIMVVSQVGIFQVVYAADDTASPKEENTVYHDYAKYQDALKKYDDDYATYEQDVTKYEQQQKAYEEAKAEADRVEAENAQKKADYDKQMAQYQEDLDRYNESSQQFEENVAAGRYIGPGWSEAHGDMEGYLNYLGAMTQLSQSGLSISGDELKALLIDNLQADNYSGDDYVKTKLDEYIDQFNVFVDFENSIMGHWGGYPSVPTMQLHNILIQVGIEKGVEPFSGVVFYHTFSSTTGQMKDNVPTYLDNPTEENIQTAINELFTKTNGAPFDSASTKMDKDTFMIDSSMTEKWASAIQEAKASGFSLYHEALQDYVTAYQKYNQTGYDTAGFEAFKADRAAASEKAHKAFNLINGFPDVELMDGDNSAPFYNDLKNLSSTELANKYGYLLLLSNMANAATYGYFHLLVPQAGEEIDVATASSWLEVDYGFSDVAYNYQGTLTPPTKPTPPTYAQVPAVPEEPVKPTPPVKPTYEPLNKITLQKVDAETNTPLANAVFELKNTDTEDSLGTFTSGDNGLIEVDNLMPGNYQLTEVTAPDGYVLDNTPVLFTVNGSENEAIELVKDNIPVTGSVELTKTDDTTNEALQGATFELRDHEGTVIKAGVQTDEEGKIVVDGLRPGDYQFIETKAPTGYELDNTPVAFTIEQNQQETVQVSMTNSLVTGGVVLTKVDEETNEKLQGAVFEL